MNTEFGTGSTRQPVETLAKPTDFYQAIDYTEKAIEQGVPAEEIEKTLLNLYSPVARQESGTRRHQMTIVAVIIASQSLKVVEALKDRVQALESKAVATPVADQLTRPAKKKARKPVKKAKARIVKKAPPPRKKSIW